jgi:hypothetical protein
MKNQERCRPSRSSASPLLTSAEASITEGVSFQLPLRGQFSRAVDIAQISQKGKMGIGRRKGVPLFPSGSTGHSQVSNVVPMRHARPVDERKTPVVGTRTRSRRSPEVDQSS